MIALLLIPAPAVGQVVDALPLVVRGGTLIDGTGRPSRVGAVVIVRGDRIDCVGTEAECPVPADARVLDATGRFLLPAFIDTHVHLHWAADSAGTRRAQQLRFAFGITTVREAGTNTQEQSNLDSRPEQADGERAMPRLFVAGFLKPGDSTSSGYEDPSAQVRRLAALGFDAIKVKELLPPQQLLAAAVVAHGLGLPVFGHAWAIDEPLAPAAYDGISHLYSIAPAAIRAPESWPPRPDPSAPPDVRRIWNKSLWLAADSAALTKRIQALVGQPTWLEPLLINEEDFVHQRAIDTADLDYAALLSVRRTVIELPARAARDQAVLDEVLVRIRAFVLDFQRAGGILVAGSDNATIPGISFHWELAALVAAGLTPAEALAAGSRNAAVALQTADRLGTIEPGKLADLVILDADPLVDIRHTRRVWRVVKAGVVHDPSAMLASLRREGRVLAASGGSVRSRKRLAAAGPVLASLLLLAGLTWRRRRRVRRGWTG